MMSKRMMAAVMTAERMLTVKRMPRPRVYVITGVTKGIVMTGVGRGRGVV
jgi:hypothetical protein